MASGRKTVKRRAGMVLGVAAVCAVILLVWSYRQRAERRTAEAFAALNRCMLGAEPLDEPAHRRLRAVEIAASLEADQDSWPARCAPYLAELNHGVATLLARRSKPACGNGCCSDDTRCTTLSELREELAYTAELLKRGKSDAFDADRLVALGQRLEFDASSPSWVPAAPAAAKLLDARGMTPLYRGNYLRLLTDPAGDDSLELLFYEHETRYGHCVVDVGGQKAASCRILSGNIPVGLAGELLAAEHGAPLRMFAQGPRDEGWSQALYDVSSGERILDVAQRPAGGFVWRDGSFARIGLDPPMDDWALYRVRQQHAEPPVSLELPSDVSAGPRLMWDEVVWTVPSGEGRHAIYARRAGAGAQALGAPLLLGEVDALDSVPSFDVCRTDDALVLMVAGWRRDVVSGVGGTVGALLFRSASGWSEAVPVRADSPFYGFTCQQRRATISWAMGAGRSSAAERRGGPALSDADAQPVAGSYFVNRLRCTEAGCKHARARVALERFSRSSRYVAGDLGDAMVVLWRSRLGDVRMRVAPLEQLADAPDRPVFDDIEHDGFGWDLERDPIFGRAGSVVVLVSRQIETSEDSATYGFRIAADGSVAPVQLAGDSAPRAL
jgi:hypothetical protein